MKLMLTLFPISMLFACSDNKLNSEEIHSNYAEISDFNHSDTLFLVSDGPYELGEDFCYLNQKGDTIIPFGKYTGSFSDTIFTFGIVIEKKEDKSELIGINQKGEKMYEVQWYDNGPDYLEDGLFRILRDGKTGYADATGKIVIQPVYECAFPFANGKAKVSYNCESVKVKEYTESKTDHWVYIDSTGAEIK